MYQSECIGRIMSCRNPDAQARVRGSGAYPCIGGQVRLYSVGNEVLLVTSLYGLPYLSPCSGAGVLGMHIHGGGRCSGNREDPFADAGSHYDTEGCPHPYHQGDLPPVFVNKGLAWGAVVTDRFTIEEIRGKTVIIHRMPDDFMTQPSGNSGEKIACGVIY